MILGNYDHGCFRLINLARGVTWAGAGNQTSISFKDFPSRLGKMRVAVIDLIIRVPKPSFAVVADKNLDGYSLAQVWGQSSLFLAENSPPEQGLGGQRALWNSVDGPRLCNALAWCTGGKLWDSFPDGGTSQVAVGADGHWTSYSAQAEQVQEGWMSQQGAFGSSDATAYTWNQDYRIRLPIGRRYGEPLDRFAIPMSWLNGDYCACDRRSEPGKLEFTLGAKVDDQAVTYGADGIDIDALVFLYPDDQVPCPNVLQIKTGRETSRFQLRKGIQRYFAFHKGLEADGDEPASDYTDVYLRCNGEEITNHLVAEELRRLRAMGGEEFKHFPISLGTLAMTHAGQDRKLTPGVPLIMHRGQPFHAPGDLDYPIDVEVSTSGEANDHWTVHALDTENSPKALEAALRLDGRAGMEARPSTKNGRRPNSVMARALPHKLVMKAAAPAR